MCPEPTQVKTLGIFWLLSYNSAVFLDHKPFPALCWTLVGGAVLDRVLGVGKAHGWGGSGIIKIRAVGHS